jgi:hypothetical protein
MSLWEKNTHLKVIDESHAVEPMGLILLVNFVYAREACP